ncbi:MAG: TAXI family TRAP transporter solute-binding subunit [Bacillota bacterium]|nr:TAXI family TRAP transporter solute-binding subunit [Bacillota bacterium]MDW7678034.1 TAXI family TRAP transporter solute-binding subunit [Bacillota bacterium]
MKKRQVIMLLAAVLTLSVMVTGCGGGAGDGDGDAPAASQELLFATGGTAGTYYPLGGAIAAVWNDNIDTVNVTIQPSGASVENLRLLDSRDADIVMAMNNIAEDAWYGEGSFEGKEVKGFRAVGVVYPEIIQGVGLVESGVFTIQDQLGKTVAGGPPGSGTAATTPHIFAAYGIGEGDMTVVNDTFGDAVDKMKDGHVDAAWNVLGAPASAIVDLLTVREVAFLEITGAELESLQNDFPLIAPWVIPAGTYNYRGQDYPEIHTIALQAVLYVRDDMDDDTVYNLAKVMYEETEAITRSHQTGSQVLLENALNGITTEFHPGAIRFYEEQGMM